MIHESPRQERKSSNLVRAHTPRPSEPLVFGSRTAQTLPVFIFAFTCHQVEPTLQGLAYPREIYPREIYPPFETS